MVAVTDSCGRGQQQSVSFDGTPLPVYYSTADQPCLESNYTISVDQMRGVTYQWYKDDVLIAGATNHDLTLNNVQASDAGTYKVEITLDGCTVFLSSKAIMPKSCDLPVTLVDFVVKEEAGNISLHWSTSEEVNSEYFEIQKSASAKDWRAIGKVNASRNSSSMQRYSFNDPEINNPSKLYYRLKMVDADQTYTYSSMEVVTLENYSESLMLYPNRASNYITLSSNNQPIKEIKILNLIGRTVLTIKNPSSYQVDISDLPTGLHILYIDYLNGSSDHKKFMIRKE